MTQRLIPRFQLDLRALVYDGTNFFTSGQRGAAGRRFTWEADILPGVSSPYCRRRCAGRYR
jgi:hypothetical protein